MVARCTAVATRWSKPVSAIYEHLCLADIGMVKGKTPVSDEAVAKAAAQGKAKLPK